MATERAWLISHTNSDGKTGAAQAQIIAKSESVAREEFAIRFPDRVLNTIHEKGKE